MRSPHFALDSRSVQTVGGSCTWSSTLTRPYLSCTCSPSSGAWTAIEDSAAPSACCLNGGGNLGVDAVDANRVLVLQLATILGRNAFEHPLYMLPGAREVRGDMWEVR